jgi:two-component system, chemotaxis family, protein-glutamate methylesterase/glutaminase
MRGIVVIGGSAGALDPLRSLLAQLPADFGAAVFCVLHLPSHRDSLLADALNGKGRLPVGWARDEEAIVSGRVYLAPPDYHLLLTREGVHLTRGPRENRARPSVDVLFRSAAVAFAADVTGIVLSGYLSDGAAGLAAIKQRGGVTLVQDPDEAVADAMPRAAMEATTIDYCLPAEEIGRRLPSIIRQPGGTIMPVPQEMEIEVEIAMGGPSGSDRLRKLGNAVTLTCPECKGVLTEVRESKPLRYRCQIGHAYTADTLLASHDVRVHNAAKIALRLVEEHVELLTRMASDAEKRGHREAGRSFEERALEYREAADVLRCALWEEDTKLPLDEVAE